MVSARKMSALCVLSGLLLLLAAGSAAAKPPGAHPGDQTDFLLRTPDSRAQGWQAGILEFVAAHPNLTSEQANAIQKLADFDTSTAFPQNLEPSTRILFSKRLEQLGQALPYRDYLGMLRSFDDELRVWLVRNGLASKEAAATDTCTCSSSGGCASGYTCENVTCIHEGGTTHDGRCGAIVLIE
jgi:hypothetical protein